MWYIEFHEQFSHPSGQNISFCGTPRLLPVYKKTLLRSSLSHFNPVHFLLKYKDASLVPIPTERHKATHILIRNLVKFSVVSLRGEFGTQGMEGCLCYMVVVGTEPTRKLIRVIAPAAANSHLDAFPNFIKATYFLDMLAKLRKATISFLMYVCLSVRLSVW